MDDGRTLGEEIRKVLDSGLREIRVTGIWWNWAWSEERGAYWPGVREPYDPEAVDLEAVRGVLRAIAESPMGRSPADPYGGMDGYNGGLRILIASASSQFSFRMTSPEDLPKDHEVREMMMGLRPKGVPVPPGVRERGGRASGFAPAPLPELGSDAPEAHPDRPTGGEPAPAGEPPLPSIAEMMRNLREERDRRDETV